jgi:hypothetical protein
MSELKVGDITPNGFEIVSVTMKPIYKMKKKIKMNNTFSTDEFKGKEGWMYLNGPFTYIILDGESREYKFPSNHYDFV